MKQIPLKNGGFALCDDADFDWLSKWEWKGHIGYARRSSTKAERQEGKTAIVLMHREIMQAERGQDVDHIKTGDTLNNQRSNLRLCTRSQNMMNHGPHSNNTSGFKGVYRVGQKWQAKVQKDYKQIVFGCFDTPREAAIEYNRAARELFGEFAYQNPV